MQHLSLFSGAGGSEWTALLLGWKTIGYVEHDDYCKEVIRARIRDGIFSDAPIFSDVRAFDGLPYRGKVDILSAGFPCQPFSVAGKREADSSERNLWPEVLRVVEQVGPAQIFLENVPGLLAGSHGYFGTILKELAECGYNAKWKVLSAREFGAPHLRKRLWVVADSHRKRRNSRRVCERGKASEERARPTTPRRSWWKTEPSVGRVVNGLADRINRIEALGNGWVPAVAAAAWCELNEQ